LNVGHCLPTGTGFRELGGKPPGGKSLAKKQRNLGLGRFWALVTPSAHEFTTSVRLNPNNGYEEGQERPEKRVWRMLHWGGDIQHHGRLIDDRGPKANLRTRDRKRRGWPALD